MAQLHKTTLLAQWFGIWQSVEITVMQTYIHRLMLLIMMVAVMLSHYTALQQVKVL
jgi:hypothetical protein